MKWSVAFVLVACGGATKSDDVPAKDAGAVSATTSIPTATKPPIRVCSPPDEEATGACASGDRCTYSLPKGEAYCRKYPKSGGYPLYNTDGACECVGGSWTCAPSGGAAGFGVGPCPSNTPPPRTACAKGEACVGLCGTNEECFTTVGCGETGEVDGGFACGRNGDTKAPGDDACHQKCEQSRECPKGQDCVHVLFPGCQDYNGSPKGKGICCAANEHCQ